jgi:hypothetical protein
MTRLTNDLNVCVRLNYAFAGLGAALWAPVPSSRKLTWWETASYGPADGLYDFTGHEYSIEPTTRIAIDPNVRVRGNGTYAGFEDVAGPIAVGDQVEVYEAESNLVGVGRVTEIDGERELVYLSVDWSSLTDEPAPTPPSSATVTHMVFVPSESAVHSNSDRAWTMLAARPSLACVCATDGGMSVVAPALGWTNSFSATWSISPDLQTFEYLWSDQIAVMT